MKFVVFHGSFGHSEEHWFPQLKEKLGFLGQSVIIPSFPCENWDEITKAGPKATPRKQSLESWFSVFEDVQKSFKKNEKLCFIGHSLGPLFILHVVQKYKIKLDSAIFVSPFMSELNKLWQFDFVNKSFYKKDFDFTALKKLIHVSYVLYSESDPYVDHSQPLEFSQKMGSSIICVKKAGHMNSQVNLNEFPLVYELCKSRLDLTLYQRYLEHRQELFATNYFKGKHEEVIYLKPEEIFDEGLFHFRNLSNKGFCTFFTGLKFWDTHGLYYEESRKAAKRIKEFVRVYVVDTITDLDRQILINQIELDLKANIKVYFVMLKDVQNVPEPDFGIWDKDYVCVVRFDKNKQIEVKLSSRKKDITKAEGWKKILLKRAVRIYNIQQDIQTFIRLNSSSTKHP